MTDPNKDTGLQNTNSETKKNITDRLEEMVDDASHRIMNEAGDVQHKLGEVADDLGEVVTEQFLMMKERVRDAVDYAEDGIEAITLRRDIGKLEGQLDIAYRSAGKKMWRLYRSGKLEIADQECIREIDRIKRLQDRINKKKKTLKSLC